MIYDSTPENSVLRKLLVDSMVVFGRPAWFKRHGSDLNADFLFDLGLANIEMLQGNGFHSLSEKRKWYHRRRDQHFEVEQSKAVNASAAATRVSEKQMSYWDEAAEQWPYETEESEESDEADEWNQSDIDRHYM